MTTPAPARDRAEPPLVRNDEPPAQGTTLHVLGNLITFLLRGADTGMRFSLVECRTAPGAGSPPHLHTEDEEAFHVLEGSYEFTIGGETVTRGPGTITTVKRGVPHAFRNPGGAPARMLIVNWPADMHERFFAAVGEPVAGDSFPEAGPPDIPKLMAAAEACGIQLLPPQPA